jgi:rubrerythrin
MEVLMPTEQEKVISALKFAIQMEIDGKVFYLKAGQESGNELGRKLLESLAKEEDYHRRKFEQIYGNISHSSAFAMVDFQPDGGRTLRTIFARELEKPASRIKVMKTEPDAIQRAMEMEDKSYDFYHARSEQAGPGPEKDFYEAVAAEIGRASCREIV